MNFVRFKHHDSNLLLLKNNSASSSTSTHKRHRHGMCQCVVKIVDSLTKEEKIELGFATAMLNFVWSETASKRNVKNLTVDSFTGKIVSAKHFCCFFLWWRKFFLEFCKRNSKMQRLRSTLMASIVRRSLPECRWTDAVKRFRFIYHFNFDFDSGWYFHTTNTQCINLRWREARGLPNNPNKESILTTLPDYSYLDGRPTPLGVIFCQPND